MLFWEKSGTILLRNNLIIICRLALNTRIEGVTSMGEERDITKIEKLTEKRKSDKIEKYIHDKDFEVVKAAINALGKIQDETSVNILSKLIEDKDPEVRKVAIVAFASGNTEYAKTFLQHLLVKEKLEDVKEVAKAAILNMKLRR